MQHQFWIEPERDGASPYPDRFATEDEARFAAEKLSVSTNGNVFVLKVIGVAQRQTHYVLAEEA